MSQVIPGISPPEQDFPEPTWEIAELFPPQGMWSEEEYLALPGNRLIEFSHGHVEVLSMPTTTHQLIMLFLYRALLAFTAPSERGTVLVAPLPMRLRSGKFREPDVLFMLKGNAHRVGDQYWEGADLVMEVVNDGDRRRDLEIKRHEYARTGIPEYWIVDPQLRQITVLKLEGQRYVVHGQFTWGQRAASHLLPGFEVDVEAALSAK
jgi:Uma2 family endonuclease